MLFWFLCWDRRIQFFLNDKSILRGNPSKELQFLLRIPCDATNISVLFNFYKNKVLVYQPSAHGYLTRLAEKTNIKKFDLIPSLQELFKEDNGLTEEYLRSLMFFWLDSYNKNYNFNYEDDLEDNSNTEPNAERSFCGNLVSFFNPFIEFIRSIRLHTRQNHEYFFSLSSDLYQTTSNLLISGFEELRSFISKLKLSIFRIISTSSQNMPYNRTGSHTCENTIFDCDKNHDLPTDMNRTTGISIKSDNSIDTDDYQFTYVSRFESLSISNSEISRPWFYYKMCILIYRILA